MAGADQVHQEALTAEQSQGARTASASRLPHLERQFDLMVKGARSLDLGLWQDRFDDLRVDARDGTITAEQIADLIDYDYQTGQDAKRGLTTILRVLLADALRSAAP